MLHLLFMPLYFSFFPKAFYRQAHKKFWWFSSLLVVLRPTHTIWYMSCLLLATPNLHLVNASWHTTLIGIFFALSQCCKWVDSTFLQVGATHTLLLYSLVLADPILGTRSSLLSYIFVVIFCPLLMSSYFPIVVWYFIPHHKFSCFCLVQLKMSFFLSGSLCTTCLLIIYLLFIIYFYFWVHPYWLLYHVSCFYLLFCPSNHDFFRSLFY